MKIKNIFVLCATTLAFAACGSDTPVVTMKPSLPSSNDKPVTSITRRGSIESAYDWKFVYNDGRLVSADGTLRDASPSVDGTFSYNSTFTYGANDVSLKSSTGENITLVLGAEGFIQKMLVNRNVYVFQYNYSGQLSGWSKQVFEESLGQIQQYNSSATIAYDEQGSLQKIEYKGIDNRKTILTFTNGTRTNTNGIMPPTIALEMGCIGFEQLYYAGLLGRPTRMLVNAIKYDYYDDSNNISSTKTINFDYGFERGNVGSCNYRIYPSNEVANVIYEYK